MKKYGLHAALLITFALFIILPKINSIPDQDMEREAKIAADTFLDLVDADAYEQSWQSSAPLLQSKINQEDWTEKLKAFRMVLGKPVSRENTSSSYATRGDDGPDGQYIILTYKTQFDRREQVAKETLTVMLTENLRWKVAGYFVK